MSTKAILLKRNPDDAAKFRQMRALRPNDFAFYREASMCPAALKFEGTADYLLVTGGHGDFVGGGPTKFNDLSAAMARMWIRKLRGDYEAIILDTCFSSAFCPEFLGHLPMGGYIVCAHGSGEGWAMAFDSAHPNRTVGEALSTVIDNCDGMGLGFSSISLLCRLGTGLILYTANAGGTRTAGLATRTAYGMDHDTPAELAQLDAYLQKKWIVVHHMSNRDLKARLKQNLKMTVL